MSAWSGRVALAVDDNEDSRKLAMLMLKREGLVVTGLENGRQALEHAGGSAVDVILMDLEMPEMGGLEATRAIRALVPSRPVKIVALSAHADEAVKAQCLASGADAYLVKPMRLADLQRVLATLFAA